MTEKIAKKSQETTTTKQRYHRKLLSPKSGTATSSPHNATASPTNKIFNTLWHMKKNAYADTTIKATGKRLKHLK